MMDRRRLISLSAATVGAAAVSVVAPPALAFRDRDCSDFRTQRQAQRFYKKQQKKTGKRDAHRLDADRDGIACEDLR